MITFKVSKIIQRFSKHCQMMTHGWKHHALLGFIQEWIHTRTMMAGSVNDEQF